MGKQRQGFVGNVQTVAPVLLRHASWLGDSDAYSSSTSVRSVRRSWAYWAGDSFAAMPLGPPISLPANGISYEADICYKSGAGRLSGLYSFDEERLPCEPIESAHFSSCDCIGTSHEKSHNTKKTSGFGTEKNLLV